MIRKIFIYAIVWAAFLCGWTLPVTQAMKPEGPEIYQQTVEPMGTLECARCHYSVFEAIRDKGGAHQLACGECHEIFHTFRPGKKWEDVVPACSDCHDSPHGGAMPDCIRCHENAHAPVADLNVVAMEQDCSGCHSQPADELKDHPSAHTDTGCTDCHHDRHGFIPGCTECHEQPHVRYRDNSGCKGCHPVHKPMVIRYDERTDDGICAACHDGESQQLLSGNKKHRFLKCVFCHSDEHGFIPKCQACHKNGPHSRDLLEKFRGCNNCHGDAHSLSLQEP